MVKSRTKYKNAVGNGQSQCTLCKKRGIYNVNWTDFFYKIDGMDGIYCYNCVNEIINSQTESEEK